MILLVDVGAEKAARAVAELYLRQGKRVLLACAPPRRDGYDFNDSWQDDGPQAVEAALQAARPWPPVPGASLPPYFPGPTGARDAVLADQRAAIRRALDDALALTAGWREVERRQREAFRGRGAGRGRDEPRAQRRKAALTRQIKAEVAAANGWAKIPAEGERTLFTGSQGTGKSRTSAEWIASQHTSEAVLGWLVPTLDKAEEQAAEYRALAGADSPAATVVRGRGAADPLRPGEAMCPRHQVVNRAAAAGVDVEGRICPSCPQKGTCGYQRQRRSMPETGLFFGAHEYAFLHWPAPTPDVWLIDEAVIGRAGDLTSFDPSRITEDEHWAGGGLDATLRRRGIAASVRAALLEHCGRELAHLREAGIAPEDVRDCCRHLAGKIDAAIGVSGAMSDAQIGATLDALAQTEARKIWRLFRQIELELPIERRRLNTVRFEPAWPTRVEDRLERLPRVFVGSLRQLAIPKRAPVVLLDGTGSLHLNRALFGERLVERRFAVERDSSATQVTRKTFSRQSITGARTDGARLRPDEAARLRAELVECIDRLDGDVFVALTNGAEAALRDELPAHATTAHFGELRGRNEWERIRHAVVIGREQPSATALEHATLPFTALDPEPFLPLGTYVAQTRRRRMRAGPPSIERVDVHPDPRAQAMLEQIREAEIAQAVDRPRPLWHPCELHLLTNIVADVTVDRVAPWPELRVGGDRLERLLARAGEVLPLAPKHLRRRYPDLFPSAATARRTAEAVSPKGLFWEKCAYAKERPIWRLSIYREPTQTQWSHALVRADCSAPRVALERELGRPVAEFRLHELPSAAGEPRVAPAAFGPRPVAPPPAGFEARYSYRLARRAAPLPITVVASTQDDGGGGLWPDKGDPDAVLELLDELNPRPDDLDDWLAEVTGEPPPGEADDAGIFLDLRELARTRAQGPPAGAGHELGLAGRGDGGGDRPAPEGQWLGLDPLGGAGDSLDGRGPPGAGAEPLRGVRLVAAGRAATSESRSAARKHARLSVRGSGAGRPLGADVEPGAWD